MKQENKTEEFSNDQIARRKLLTMAAYVPPAILGVMIAGSKIAEAGAPVGTTKACKGGGMITVSAGGSACCPCVPGDPKYNLQKCIKERCKLGNCPACKQIIFTKEKDCTKKVAKSGCACTCVETPAGSGFWRMTGC